MGTLEDQSKKAIPILLEPFSDKMKLQLQIAYICDVSSNLQFKLLNYVICQTG